MENNEFQQAVLAQLQMLNTRLDRMDDRLTRLEAGQADIRADIKRLDEKIDQLSTDVGSALVNLADNTDKVIQLKILK